MRVSDESLRKQGGYVSDLNTYTLLADGGEIVYRKFLITAREQLNVLSNILRLYPQYIELKGVLVIKDSTRKTSVLKVLDNCHGSFGLKDVDASDFDYELNTDLKNCYGIKGTFDQIVNGFDYVLSGRGVTSVQLVRADTVDIYDIPRKDAFYNDSKYKIIMRTSSGEVITLYINFIIKGRAGTDSYIGLGFYEELRLGGYRITGAIPVKFTKDIAIRSYEGRFPILNTVLGEVGIANKPFPLNSRSVNFSMGLKTVRDIEYLVSNLSDVGFITKDGKIYHYRNAGYVGLEGKSKESGIYSINGLR